MERQGPGSGAIIEDSEVYHYGPPRTLKSDRSAWVTLRSGSHPRLPSPVRPAACKVDGKRRSLRRMLRSTCVKFHCGSKDSQVPWGTGPGTIQPPRGTSSLAGARNSKSCPGARVSVIVKVSKGRAQPRYGVRKTELSGGTHLGQIWSEHRRWNPLIETASVEVFATPFRTRHRYQDIERNLAVDSLISLVCHDHDQLSRHGPIQMTPKLRRFMRVTVRCQSSRAGPR